MKAPDTSPRWDRSSWQIDATRRALRTAAREGAPGRGGADPSRRCRKKGLYMSPLMDSPDCAGFCPRYGIPDELCQSNVTTQKTLPQASWGRAGLDPLEAISAPGTGDSRMFYFIAASTARLAITVIRCAR